MIRIKSCRKMGVSAFGEKENSWQSMEVFWGSLEHGDVANIFPEYYFIIS